jgi:hypothetical protein
MQALGKVESHTWLGEDNVKLVIGKVTRVENVDRKVFPFPAEVTELGMKFHKGGGDSKGVFNLRGSVGVRVAGNDTPPDVFNVVVVNGIPENQGVVEQFFD